MSSFGDLVADSLDPTILEQFGGEVTYQPRSGSSYTLTAVLDSGQAVQDARRAYQTLWAPSTSFEAEPVKGDSVVIDSVTYRVADVEKQHLGGRLLMLSVMA